MKVCTDSCLFGAYVADKIEQKIIQPKRILDIGAGTGLLSLMVAQKSEAIIDAVEIDEGSFIQTNENFLESAWSQRLQVFHTDIKRWNAPDKYDFIVSNPPYFENDLRSENKNKNLAKHHDGLTFEELLCSIKEMLVADGNFAVIIPYRRITFFKLLATQNNFYLKEELLIKQTPGHSYFRTILFFGTKPAMVTTREFIIKNPSKNYTVDFILLLKDYYLNL